jgi:hypothetical protein
MNEIEQKLPCVDKIKFDTKSQAETAALVAKWHYGPNRLKAYRCRFCQLWHLAGDHDE